MRAAAIDSDALLQVVWVSGLAGVGGTALFALAVLGAARSADLMRAGRTAAGAALAVLAAAMLGVAVAGVIAGLLTLTGD